MKQTDTGYARWPTSAALLLLGAFCCAPAFAQNGNGAPVSVDEVREQQVYRVIPLTGTVTAARSARLSAATSGLVTTLLVDAGSQVSQEEVLLTLDRELAERQLQSASAVLEQRSTALADAQRRLGEARVLEKQRNIAETLIRGLVAEVAEAQATVREARAEANYQRGILERHTLKAPFAGVISAKLTELGEWVSPGEPVLELVALDNVRLDFKVSEDYLADLHKGAAVSFTLNSD
ncbi:MAG: efflux RND transporter periplasmic adaptor subunit, partial [Pseudomonadales bacterium]|nr:efflux RND transporter periplasmic adaptor subunit [Pseudomonadales bacterium]